MNIGTFLPIGSFFFNQILDDVRVTGLVLSQKIMALFDKKEIYKMLKDINLNQICYEKCDNISIYIVSKVNNDQVWLVKFDSKNILMLSSEY